LGRALSTASVSYVLDATALIAFLRREPGGHHVWRLLRSRANVCYAHAINLCEVYYDFHRAAGEQAAEDVLRDLRLVGVVVREEMDADLWKQAGQLKSVHRRVSLADCLCIALAQRVDGEVVTGDHHEFDAIAPLGLCRIHFIR
jgi:PIN domain nuclease of toxin-antitoxin system